MKKTTLWLGISAGLLILSGGPAHAYDYPFDDPYVATVIGTPTEYAQPLPEDVPVKVDSIRMFPDRKVAEVLWSFKDMRYSYSCQKEPSPLIFLVAGTGASYQSAKMKAMQKAFYRDGHHVISISSPTVPSFIVAASTSGIPGHLGEDSEDLYRVMEAIWNRLKPRMKVTRFHLAGYSLGATQAAFIAKLDEEKRVFNFRKVLLINPSVNLYNSVSILDAMLVDNIPGGMDNFHAFYRELIDAFSEVYAHDSAIRFNDNFLYEAYNYRRPQEIGNIQALIGISFRISCQNLTCTSDVMTRAGYVIPKGLELGRHARLTSFAKTYSRLSFTDYFDGIMLPHFRAQDPTITRDGLIEKMGLSDIEDYLRAATKIGVIHNEDDLILRPGEIDYLRSVFGKRAFIFPIGGHCGNMGYPDNVNTMLRFFRHVHRL